MRSMVKGLAAMLKDIAPKGRPLAVRSARRLRRAMTLPEVLLGQILRSRPDGLKFRRQHPCGPYILDFFCGDARLATEIDGEVHGRGDRPRRDAARDDWLEASGIATLRVPARAMLDDADSVVRWVVAEAVARMPLHHPAAPDGPPPRDELGEEFT